jgi:hypothetical protein
MMKQVKLKAQSISKLLYPIPHSIKGTRVHSTFDRSCNILFDDLLIGIVPLEFGNNPNAIVLQYSQNEEPWTGFIKQGMPVQIDGNQILIGPIKIDLSDANFWNPELILDFTDIKNKLTCLSTLITSIPNPSIFLKTSFDYFNNQAKSDPLSEYISTKITFFVENLFVKDIEYSQKELDVATLDLVGLGYGLTPSGDDFLAGLIGTLNCFAKNNHLSPILNEQIITLNKVIYSTLGTSKTNLISETLLENALSGFLSETIGDFLRSLFKKHGNSEKNLDERLEDLLSIGHSSGADFLAGIYIATVKINNQSSKL